MQTTLNPKPIPFTVDAGAIVQLFVAPTIEAFKDKEPTPENNGVLVTAYFALELYYVTAKSTLTQKKYITTLQHSQYLNVKSFEDLFGMKPDKQKSLRSKLHDPLPYFQVGDKTLILYNTEDVCKWMENYKKYK